MACHCEPVNDFTGVAIRPPHEVTADMYYVYILANLTNTVIYTGVTNDLCRRVYEHRQHLDPNSFTAKYHVTKLVYYDASPTVTDAIEREKQIKGWNRKRKNKLIASMNPEWKDLSETLK